MCLQAVQKRMVRVQLVEQFAFWLRNGAGGKLRTRVSDPLLVAKMATAVDANARTSVPAPLHLEREVREAPNVWSRHVTAFANRQPHIDIHETHRHTWLGICFH